MRQHHLHWNGWILLLAVSMLAAFPAGESRAGTAEPAQAVPEEADARLLAEAIVREAESLRAEVMRLRAALHGNRMRCRELEDSLARLRRDLAELQAAVDQSQASGPLARVPAPDDPLAQGVEAMRRLLAGLPSGKFHVLGIAVDPLNPIDPPPVLEGRVVLSPGRDEVKIDRGSADGLHPQHHLEVYQAEGGLYLGRIEIVATTPHGSLARILPEHRRAAIVAGARVSTIIE